MGEGLMDETMTNCKAQNCKEPGTHFVILHTRPSAYAEITSATKMEMECYLCDQHYKEIYQAEILRFSIGASYGIDGDGEEKPK